MHTRRSRGEKRFTLVEMLVVVAIIGILAALLLPGLQGALAAARTVECSNNMRSFYSSVITFSDDYGGFLPPAVTVAKLSGFENALFPTPAQASTKNKTWYNKTSSNLYWPYIEPLRFAFCPEQPAAAFLGNPVKDLSWQQWSGYRVPSNHFSSVNYYSGALHTEAKRLNQRPHPSKLFLFLDTTTLGFSMTYQQNYDTSAYGNIGWYHNRDAGFNANFFDGHVSFTPLNYTPTTRLDPPLIKDNWE